MRDLPFLLRLHASAPLARLKIDGLPCTIKYENAHYIISMERDKQAFAE